MILIFLLLFSLFTLNIKAQNTCGTDELHERMMLENTNYKNAFLQQKATVQNKLQYKRMHPSSQQAASPQQYTIPVVVHVIHLGESEGLGSNIPDSQIYGAIDGLNDRYSNTIGSGLDMDINFCLATTTPEGCPTNGINRVDGSGIPNYASDGMERSNCTGGDEEDLKDLSKWPVSDYYNIWVVHDICGSVAGFAYYPWGGAYDGTVMYSPYMRYNQETLAHELGHGLNLPHTFNGDNDGNSCPVNNDCTNDGDYICDTPPHKRGDCGTSNPCTGSGVWSNSRNNYMSYCSSRDLFTSDQKDRMQATMEVYPRADLVNSLGCTPLNVEIYSSQDSICTGGSMVLTAIGDHIDTYEWSTGETAQSITVSPTVSTNYSVTATSIGGCTVTDSKTITILSGSYPPQPGNISGNTNPCSGSISSYSIASVNGANSYNWYFTGNGIISGSGTSIDLQVNSSGTLYVEGVNHCGSGDTSSLSINLLENTGATITRYVCDAYTAPDGQVYDTSGLYTAVMNNAAGCDSIITIDLIVAPAAEGLQSNGDILACSEDGLQTLSVNAASGAIVDWYDAPLGGNLLASNSTTYTTSVPGTYYAQARSTFFVEPGDTVSGGIFAYKFGPNDLGYHTSGIKGLIAAASDQASAAVWGCEGTFIGNTSQSVGTGQHNTKAIVQNCAEPGIAARLCDSLILNGYGDWYLPSFLELEQLFANKNEIGGFVTNSFSGSRYFSSTENNNNSIWILNFNNGTFYNAWGKDLPGNARAVRTLDIPDTSCINTNRIPVTYSVYENDTVISKAICPNTTFLGYSAPGTYIDTFVGSNGCDSLRTIQLSKHPEIPPIPDTEICLYDTAVINSNGGEDFLWSTGDTSSSISVSPTSNTSYYVSISDQYQCSYTDTFEVVVNPLPVANAGNDTSICLGDKVNLMGKGGSNYTWNTGEQTASIEVSPIEKTTYRLSVKDSNNCESAGADSVTIDVMQLPALNTSPDTTICAGDSTILYANGPGEILWNTADTSNVIIVSPASDSAKYIVQITDSNHCINKDTLSVFTNQLTELNFENLNTDLCLSDQEINLMAYPQGGVFSGNGVDKQKFSPQAAGIGNHEIRYTYTDTNACENSISKTIEVKNCTGINDPDPAASFKIFPNPFNDKLHIQNDGSESYDYKIIDLLGNVVEEEYNNRAAVKPIALPALSSGVYFLHIHTKSGLQLSKKIVKW